MLILFHVVISRLYWVFDVTLRLEGFLVSNRNLCLTVFFAEHGLGGLLERITNGCVSGLSEKDLVTCTLLARSGPNVGRVDLNLFGICARNQSRYNKIPRLDK